MTAAPIDTEPTGLIEDLTSWRAKRDKAHAQRTGRTPGSGTLTFWATELTGTTAAFAAFTVGAFLHLAPMLAYLILGVSLLVINTKVTIGMRKRRAAVRAEAEAAQAAEAELERKQQRGPLVYR